MFSLLVATALLAAPQKGLLQDVSPGSLIAPGKVPLVLPLKNTDVNADISGFSARVTVVQTFTNPSTTPIEAIYTFPLPADSAVDRMRMQLGDRIITGQIKRREEAQAIYTAAKSQGQAAALLDQERPNIFTQSVANILPNSTVRIEISYVQLLRYEAGQFEFNFPMVVGPRYLGNAPDPRKIAPPIVPPGMRTGANISITVNLDAGAPVIDMKSVLHEITTKQTVAMSNRYAASVGGSRTPPLSTTIYKVSLKKKDEIPNKDFILRYRTATDSVQSALLAKYDPVKGGYFSLILMPPKAPTVSQIAPKEMVFVMDQSGSQDGFPIEKSKELTLKLIETMNPGDTFNVMGFSNSVNLLWPEPRPSTAENRAEATKFVRSLRADGGTELRRAVEAALTPNPDPKRLRLVVFNTDGFVGDEKEILASIAKYRGNARMFTFGIGNGVNRYLIDAMSEEGRGDSEVVTLAEAADLAAARFVKRTQNPILTDVSAKFEGVDVSDQLPAQIPDVFGDKPIVIYGRYTTPGDGQLTLTGTMAGKPWSQTINVRFPSDRPGGESIPTLWARRMVDKIERDYGLGLRQSANPQEGQNKVVDLALEYGLMTHYTSFVAVEQKVINLGGKQRTVHVPVEMTDGVSYKGVFGDRNRRFRNANAPMVMGTIMAGTKSGSFAGVTPGRGGAGGSGGAPPGISFISYDPTDNSFIVSDKDIAKLSPEEQKKVRAQIRQDLFENKVAKPLRIAKAEIEAQIWLTKLDPQVLSKLKALGFTVEATDKGLKIVFGKCNAKALMELAQIEAVKRIEPIS